MKNTVCRIIGKTAATAAALALIFALASCGKEAESAYSAAERYAAEMPGMSGEKVIYRSGAGLSSPEYLSPEGLTDLYLNGKPDAGEAALLDDWCVMLAASPEVTEVHVLRVRRMSDRAAVVRMVEARARILRSPELFAASSGFFGTRPSDVRVLTEGKFVILLASGGE